MIKYRSFSLQESKLLRKLLSIDFPGRDELQAQLGMAECRRIDKNGSLQIRMGVGSRPAAVIARVPVEGSVLDGDGVVVHVLLHVVNGYMNELEIYKEDGSEVVSVTDLSRLDLICPPY